MEKGCLIAGLAFGALVLKIVALVYLVLGIVAIVNGHVGDGVLDFVLMMLAGLLGSLAAVILEGM